MNTHKLFGSLVILSLLLTPLLLDSRYPAEVTPGLKQPKFSGSEADLEPDGGDTLPDGISSDWWAAVQEDIRRSEYHVTWQDKTYLPDVGAPSTGRRAGAYQAPNRAHNLRTYFTPQGPVVIPRVWPEGAEAPPWRWGLSLVAWGREGTLQAVDSATLHTDANRVEYHYAFDTTQEGSAIVEWYLNDERGLEQGFTIQSPPLPRSPAPLLLELSLTGDLIPRLSDDPSASLVLSLSKGSGQGGQAIEFTTPGGVRVLRYSDLHATDATGRQLPAHFQLPSPGRGGAGGGVIRLIVDDTDAVYPITVDPLATTPNWSAEGEQRGIRLGSSVGTAGDVNGDGYADIIVGAPEYSEGKAGEGAAFVYYGSACGLSTSADWSAEGDQYNAYFGSSVGTAGDVNGDGYDDVIVGAPEYSDSQDEEGAVFVWYGSATGLGADGTPDNADWSKESKHANVNLGISVGTAGDVNGDGYADVIVGAPGYNAGQPGEGVAFVYHGSDSGLGSPSWFAEGDKANAELGVSVGTAGDVNGDGYADVIVRALRHGQDEQGAAFVWYGSDSGLGANGTPDNADWSAEGNQTYNLLGHSVGTAGDVNGDGYDDVIIGVPGYGTRDYPNYGAAFVWYGSAKGLGADGTPDNADWRAVGDQANTHFGYSVSTAGDVDGDGYADVIVGTYASYAVGQEREGAFVFRGSGSGLSTLAIWSAKGSHQGSGNHPISVSTAGDVNGDGYADVIVGLPDYDGEEPSNDCGRADVYYGSASGPVPDWTKESDKANAHFGASVATAGDVNGDGYADVIVGAPGYDSGQSEEGFAFVYRGTASGPNPVPYWHAQSNQADAYFGNSVGTAGDVNGDGYADVIVGARCYAHGTDDEGAAFVWYGSATGLGADGTPDNADWTAESNREDAYFGVSVGTAGDVNGDGFSDVVVGAHYFYRGTVGEGAAFVWYGSSTGLGADGNPDNADWTAESNQSEALLGVSVGTAGDVNGDGYADVIVGADAYDYYNPPLIAADGGAAFVWYGSASGLGADGTPDNADWNAKGRQAQTYLGRSVGTAGDVNGDGYADVIVGAPAYQWRGAAFVWYGSASGLGAASNPDNADWSAESDQGGYFGGSVGTAGDVNGDGYADVIVGAEAYRFGYAEGGTAFVYYGSASGLRASPNWTVEGDQADAHLGVSVGTAGDVNGDGYADVIVGADSYDHGQTDEGRAFVWYGSASGPNTIANWDVEGKQTNAHFGYSVGTAGDVNGDGYADVIVGADDYDHGQTNEGRAFVYHGSEFGLYLVASWSAEGHQDHAHFGHSVGTAGDVNGDGYADVIVGANDYDRGQDDEGLAFVWYGSASGLGADGAPGNADWHAEGNQANASFGRSVGTAGDVNGDGYADVIVGAYRFDKGQTNEGLASVWYGSASGLRASGNPGNADWIAEGEQDLAYFGYSVGTAGDVNGDGYADVIVGAYLCDRGQDFEGATFVWYGSASGLGADGTPSNADWTAEGDQANAHFGFSVGTAGDVNGDGYADVIVGAHDYDHGQDNEGLAFVWHGSASGLGADGTPSNADWHAEGNQDYVHFGHSVGTAGDVNGDGYADVIVGAYKYDQCQRDEGRAFVYHGSRYGLRASPKWTAEGEQAYAYFGGSVGTAGDVNGDGYADVIVGAYSYDHTQGNEGRAFVYYGNGGMALSLKPRQRRADDSRPIAPLGLSEGNAFRLALRGRTPLGRGLVKLEWEVKPLGTRFNGSGTQQSATWMDTGTAGVEISELVSSLSTDTAYHWRVRLRYHPVTTPFQQHSRWLTMPWNGWQEQDLRTGSASVTLVMFSATTYNVGEGAGNVTITVNLDAASEDTVTVDYTTADGTATAGDDYRASNGTLTFNPGVTSRTFTVPILDDALEEGNETVVLSLSNATRAVIGAPNPATLTIVDEPGQEEEFHIYLPLVWRNG